MIEETCHVFSGYASNQTWVETYWGNVDSATPTPTPARHLVTTCFRPSTTLVVDDSLMRKSMESILALVSFSFVMSITPGPNNVLLMSSGLRFGVRRTLPHMAGIQFGLALQLIMCAYGLGVFITQNPVLINIMRALGTAYLCYLAWQLRHLEIKDEVKDQKPFTFLQAAVFQFINPKAWMMAITAGALLLPDFETRWLSIAGLCIIFCLVGAPSSGSWAFFGSLLKEYLRNPSALRVFNIVLIALTLMTAVSFWR